MKPSRCCARADVGDEIAAWWLTELLAECGDLDERRAHADASDDPFVAWRLAGLLAEGESGDIEVPGWRGIRAGA